MLLGYMLVERHPAPSICASCLLLQKAPTARNLSVVYQTTRCWNHNSLITLLPTCCKPQIELSFRLALSPNLHLNMSS